MLCVIVRGETLWRHDERAFVADQACYDEWYLRSLILAPYAKAT